MWERTLSQKLVRLFCEQKVVDESKADAYVYGYELLISSVVSVLLVILVSAVCGDVRYSLSFLIGFIPQRIYIGGYHATSHTRCYLAFTGLALICILLSKVIARIRCRLCIPPARHSNMKCGIWWPKSPMA